MEGSDIPTEEARIHHNEEHGERSSQGIYRRILSWEIESSACYLSIFIYNAAAIGSELASWWLGSRPADGKVHAKVKQEDSEMIGIERSKG